MNPIQKIKDHCVFNSSYVYFIEANARNKINTRKPNSNESKLLKFMIKTPEDIEIQFNKISVLCNNSSLNYYIYLSINPRDIRKGYTEMKKIFLQYDHDILYNLDVLDHRLKHLDNKWYSVLETPACKATRRYLLDIDVKDIPTELYEINFKNIVKYESNNGHHWIVDPFDVRLIEDIEFVHVKTDAKFYIDKIINY